jgi:hypothetical protein
MNVAGHMSMTEEEAVRIADTSDLQPHLLRIAVLETTKKRIAWCAVTGYASFAVQGEFETRRDIF